MKEEIKIEDLVKGEWYLIKTYQEWLVKFDKFERNRFCVLKACTPEDGYIHKNGYGEYGKPNSITKATKEKVLKYFPDEKFEEEFVLPNNWCVAVPTNLEDKILLNNWKIKQKYNYDLFKYNYKYVFYNGVGWLSCSGGFLCWVKKIEITFDQFKQYVLKIEKNNMENKKLIGYKLIKKELEKAACQIACGNNAGWALEIITLKDQINKLKEANVLDIWFEPVYENEFKIGDWIYITNSDCGISADIKKGFVGQIKEIEIESTNIYGYSNIFTYTNGSKSSNRDNCLRLATKEEIEKTTEKVISMNGSFNLTVKDKKVYHKSEDITDYVLCIGETYNSYNLKHIYSRYDFHIKDMIISKSGCESKETYLSDWLKVYELIK